MGKLVLARNRDQKIAVLIDGKVILDIDVIDIQAGKVRLGFAADRSVTILRGELLDGRERKGGAA